MPGLQHILTRRYRRRWSLSVGVLVLLVVAAIVCMWLVRHDELSRTPWLYLALAVAILGATIALALTIFEAKSEDDLTGSQERHDRARRIRGHHRHN